MSNFITVQEAAGRLDMSYGKLMGLKEKKKLHFCYAPDGKRIDWEQLNIDYDHYVKNVKQNRGLGGETRKGMQGTVSNEDMKSITEADCKNIALGERILDELKQGVKGAAGNAYAYARTINEFQKAQQGALNLMAQEGKTVPRKDVELQAYNLSRQNRDSWLQWPMIIAHEMAMELGVESKLMHDVLIKFVRIQLEKNATIPYELQLVEQKDIFDAQPDVNDRQTVEEAQEVFEGEENQEDESEEYEEEIGEE